jgi:L-aspartate oxidase
VANRLASNSLLEGLVYGAHAGEGASQSALELSGEFQVSQIENLPVAAPAETLDLADIRNSLKALMWRAAGVRRNQELLEEALKDVDQWRSYVLVRQFDDLAGWELQNMLTMARVMIASALAREESRGTHLRTDFPGANDGQWNRHLEFSRGAETAA